MNVICMIDLKNMVIAQMAYATTSSRGTRMIGATSETVPETNRELWLFEKVGGEWKIVRYMFNRTEENDSIKDS